MRILYNNYVLDGTYSATNENPNYTVIDAFEDSRLSRYMRTTGTATAITFDLLSDKTVDYVGIVGHNLSPTATIMLYGNSVNSFSSPPASFTVNHNTVISQSINDSSIDNSNFFLLVDEYDNFIVDEFGNYIVGLIYTSTYRYWQLTISDAANADGYLQISKVYLGDYLQMSHMAKNQKIPTASTSTKTENPTGQVYGDKGIVYKYGTVNLPFVTDDEKIDIDEMFDAVDKIVPFLFLIWENDLTFQPAIYSLLTSDLDWQRVEGTTQRYWSVNLGFKETF